MADSLYGEVSVDLNATRHIILSLCTWLLILWPSVNTYVGGDKCLISTERHSKPPATLTSSPLKKVDVSTEKKSEELKEVQKYGL